MEMAKRRVKAESATSHATKVSRSSPRRARRVKPSQARTASSNAPRNPAMDGNQNQETSPVSRTIKFIFSRFVSEKNTKKKQYLPPILCPVSPLVHTTIIPTTFL